MKVCNGDMLLFDQIHVLKPNFEDSVIREWEHDGFFIVKRIFVENLYTKIVYLKNIKISKNHYKYSD